MSMRSLLILLEKIACLATQGLQSGINHHEAFVLDEICGDFRLRVSESPGVRPQICQASG